VVHRSWIVLGKTRSWFGIGKLVNRACLAGTPSHRRMYSLSAEHGLFFNEIYQRLKPPQQRTDITGKKPNGLQQKTSVQQAARQAAPWIATNTP
jgi:hypothetical protein